MSGKGQNEQTVRSVADLNLTSLFSHFFTFRCHLRSHTSNNIQTSTVIFGFPKTKNTESFKIPTCRLSILHPSTIDILLGADVYYSLIKPSIHKLGIGLSTLFNTQFSWFTPTTKIFSLCTVSHCGSDK